MNKIVVIGNLTRDPELSTSESGVTYCRFGIAVPRRFGKEEANFFNVTVWRQQAENCHRYLKKGNKVAISGAVNIDNYEKDGERRTSVTIDADNVEFLTPKNDGDEGSYERKTRDISELEPIKDDDSPF